MLTRHLGPGLVPVPLRQREGFTEFYPSAREFPRLFITETDQELSPATGAQPRTYHQRRARFLGPALRQEPLCLLKESYRKRSGGFGRLGASRADLSEPCKHGSEK